ncbi:MAG: hypothetical protein HOV86_27195 [Thermoactinospora sp.]|nr:hypothetical protein [Thermoactinospora sp.]
MSSPHTSPRTGLVAAALACLTGCTGLHAEPGAQPAVAAVGSCHLMSRPEELYTGSDVAPPVSCDRPHQTETYHVTRFTGALAARAERPNPEQLAAAVEKRCPYQPIRPYLGAGPLDNQWGVTIWGTFPTRAQWAAGDRTLRCDLLVPTIRPERGPEIAVPLRGIMRGPHSALVRRCRHAGIDTACARPHHLEWVEPPVRVSWAAHPGEHRAHRFLARTCRAHARAFAGTRMGELVVEFDPITRADWDAGTREASCWARRTGGAPTTGTLAR